MVNVGYNMGSPNLKRILETILDGQEQQLSREQIAQYESEIKLYATIGDAVYGKDDIEQIVNRVKQIVDKADAIMTKSHDWLSNVAHKKNNKRMHDDYNDFENAARELKDAQDRMSMCYENIGNHLNRYFGVD
jgi:hypothetical protein